MGWTSWNTRGDAAPTADAYLRTLYVGTAPDGTKTEVVASAMVGTVWYAAVRVAGVPDEHARMFAAPEDFTTAIVVLTEGRWHSQWGYKAMDEGMGPTESKAPAAVLDRLTPLNEGRFSRYARDWRNRCRANLGARNAA